LEFEDDGLSFFYVDYIDSLRKETAPCSWIWSWSRQASNHI